MIVDTSFVIRAHALGFVNPDLVNRLSQTLGTHPNVLGHHLGHDESTITPIVETLRVLDDEGVKDPETVACLMFSAGRAFQDQQRLAAKQRVEELMKQAGV